MKTLLISLFIFLQLACNLVYSQSLVRGKGFAVNAITVAVEDYLGHRAVSRSSHMVIKLKIMKHEETKGEFSLSYDLNDEAYEYLAPTHYVHAGDRLVLIVVDNSNIDLIYDSGIKSITNSIKKEAYDILAGPGLVISAQPSPYMVVKYKGSRVKTTFYPAYHNPERKYWF